MSLYDTTQLIAALDAMDRPKAFLRDTFFGNKVFSDDEFVAVDKLVRRQSMAPFVSPDVPARERKNRSTQIKTYVPPTLKPLNAIRPKDALRRSHGEAIGGNITPEMRKIMLVNQILRDQDDEITRREEWMCAHALRSGSFAVEGEDHEREFIDYNRNAANTIALTGGDRWGEAGVSLKSSFISWAKIVQESSGGAARTVVMGTGATELFQEDEGIQAALDNRRQDGGQMQLGPVVGGAEEQPEVYLGSIGQFDFWSYTAKFTNDLTDTVEDIWPEFGVGVVSRASLQGQMAYGMIHDMEVLQAMERFPKHLLVDNPSSENILTQAAPLPVPGDVNGSLFALVR